MLKKNISIVFVITVISKGLGFLRDIVLVNQLGAGVQTDSFIAINNVIESLITLFGIQTLFSSSTTIFSEAESKNTDRWNIFSSFSLLLLLLTIPLMLLIMFAPSLLLKIMYPGFTSEASQKASVILIFFSINIVIISFIRCYNSILGIHRKFIFQNLFPLVINGTIICIVFIAPVHHAILFLCLSLTLTQSIFLIIQLILLKKMNYWYKIPSKDCLKFTGGRMKSLGLPLLLATAMVSLAGIVAQLLGSQCPAGTITFLSIGNNLVFFSVGLIFMSTINVLFPEFSRLYNMNNHVELSRLVSKTIEFAIVVFIPISVFFIAFSKEIVEGIFFKSNFSNENINTLSNILIIYGFALVPMVFNMIPNYLLQACGKNKKTGIAAIFGFSVNILTAYIMSRFYGYIGIALGLTVGHFIFSGLLLYFAEKETGILMWKSCISYGIKIGGISIVWLLFIHLIPIYTLIDKVTFVPTLFKGPTVLFLYLHYFVLTFLSIWILYKKVLKHPTFS